MELFCSKYNCSNTKPKRVCWSPRRARARDTLQAHGRAAQQRGQEAIETPGAVSPVTKGSGRVANMPPSLQPQRIMKLKPALVTLIRSIPAHPHLKCQWAWQSVQVLQHPTYSAVVYLSMISRWETAEYWRIKAGPYSSLYFQGLT